MARSIVDGFVCPILSGRHCPAQCFQVTLYMFAKYSLYSSNPHVAGGNIWSCILKDLFRHCVSYFSYRIKLKTLCYQRTRLFGCKSNVMLRKASSNSMRLAVDTSQDIDGKSVPPGHPRGKFFLNAWAMLHRREQTKVTLLLNHPSCHVKVELRNGKRVIWL